MENEKDSLNQTKLCRDCGKTKPTTEFYKYKKGTTGLHPSCKECASNKAKRYRFEKGTAIKAKQREWYINKKAGIPPLPKEKQSRDNEHENLKNKERYASNIDHCRRRNRDYRNKNKEKINLRRKEHGISNKESIRISVAKWTRNNPEKKRAHSLLFQAVKEGRLIRPQKCDACGATRKVDGHHPDYKEPLQVEWLCRSCHKLVSAK